MFSIFVYYSTRPIYDISMNLFCWPPSDDIFNILPGFLWQALLQGQLVTINAPQSGAFIFNIGSPNFWIFNDLEMSVF